VSKKVFKKVFKGIFLNFFRGSILNFVYEEELKDDQLQEVEIFKE